MAYVVYERRVYERHCVTAAVGDGNESGLSVQRRLRVILPMSDQLRSYTIAGKRFSGGGFAVTTASVVRQESRFT